MTANRCTSCGSELKADPMSVEFPCPGCFEQSVGRCGRCKKLSREYKCVCGFIGP
ncbi:TPA: DUF1610 domain-containing protein [archaeon]|nr:DUF1610 domain-containing protein [Candidatus Naiadarchaeales archaeon SRR2090153.bin461]HIK02629.1 DUF1610 domain-containing protein [Candidatus Naiadarchaeales archaeon SRR2090159.bin1288]